MEGHLWAQSKTWDPEGLVSTLPAIGNLLLGYLAGRWIDQDRPRPEKTAWLLLAGLACLWIGSMLDVVAMPINKSLWTVSYSIFTTGWALLVFGVFYWLLDAAPAERVRHVAARGFQPFVMYGMNALFLYALSDLVAKMLGVIRWTLPDGSERNLQSALYAPIQALPVASEMASLIFAIAFNGCMLAVAWLLWRKRWFIKV